MAKKKPIEGMMSAQVLVPWIECDQCPEFWCNVHDVHASECPCPAVEDWEISPYMEQKVSSIDSQTGKPA
jgi:hypothetical protein